MGSPLRAGAWIRIWRHREWWPGATAVLPELTVCGGHISTLQQTRSPGLLSVHWYFFTISDLSFLICQTENRHGTYFVELL